MAAVTITQSTDPVNIDAGGSIACNDNSTGFTAANSYFRAFTLSSFGINNPFNVTSVQIGIEQASSTNTDQPVTVNLYAGVVGFPVDFPGSFTLIGTVTENIAPQTLTLYTFTVAGTVPAGEDLIVEIFTPDGAIPGNSFFIGSNAAGQTSPSYIMAADCGLSIPGDVESIGFGNMHIVMSVTGDEVVEVDEVEIVTPNNFELFQNYPNPFNPSTKISYSIIQAGLVFTLKIYDVLGTEIETLVNEEKPTGTYELNWNAANLPSGIYFYRLQAGSFVQTRKMILLK